jgi:hypothetical protein
VFLAEDVPDLVSRDRRCVELLLSTPWGQEDEDRRMERRIAHPHGQPHRHER